MRFSGQDLEQKNEMTNTISADDKLNAMKSYSLSRIRRQQVDKALTLIEL